MKTLRNLFTALLLLCSIVASAHDFEVDGIYYKITNFTTKEVAVTYKGNNPDEYSEEYSGNVVIPETVVCNDETYSVTSIGDHAFYCCYGLASVEIPNSVTNIERSAFCYCGGLTSVVIGNSVTSIGDDAFFDCNALTSVVIPCSVTSFGRQAFYSCDNLVSIEIPNSVTSIGENAFHDTAWYNNLHDGVVYAGKLLYKYKGTMPINTSITIEEGTIAICSSAFSGYRGLASVVIPNSVTRIDDYAFNGCISLKDLRIEDGESTLSLGHGSSEGWTTGLFRECPLETLYLGRNLSYDHNPFSDITTLGSVVIGDCVTSIGGYAFSGCSTLTSIEIPNSVTSIGGYAFYGCSTLTSIEIPGSVTRIDNYAFDGCISLKDLRIEDGVSTLSLGYSSGSEGLTIGLFRNCLLETLYLGRNLSYDYNPFSDITTLGSVVIGDNVTCIGNSAFFGCSTLTSIEIPNSVTSIGESAFNGCSSLASVVIGNSVTSIGSSAFRGCSALANVVIPGSVTRIDYYAFDGCVSLKDLRIEDGETTLSLGNTVSSESWTVGLFCNCPLETLYLGRNLSYDHNPFSNIATLESIVIGNSVTSIGSGAFHGTAWYNNKPDGVVYAGKILYKYKGTMPANTSIAIEEGTTAVVSSAFSGCSGLTNVVIPNSVTSIGNNAFYY